MSKNTKKKIAKVLAMLMVFCLLAGTMSISAFAAPKPNPGGDKDKEIKVHILNVQSDASSVTILMKDGSSFEAQKGKEHWDIAPKKSQFDPQNVAGAKVKTGTGYGDDGISVTIKKIEADGPNNFKITLGDPVPASQGKLTVKKTVEGDVDLPSNFQIEIKFDGEIVDTLTLNDAEGNGTANAPYIWELSGLSNGTYTAEESNYGVDGYICTPSGNTTAQVAATAVASIEITNTYESQIAPPPLIPTGDLTVTKAFSGIDTIPANFSITLTTDNELIPAGQNQCILTPEEANGTGTLEDPFVWELDGVPVGTCTAAENGADVQGYIRTVRGSRTATVAQNIPASISLTNVYTPDVPLPPQDTPETGMITVTKAFSGIDAIPEGFELRVMKGTSLVAALNAANAVSGNGTEATPYKWNVLNITAGTYTVEEYGAEVEGYTLTLEGNTSAKLLTDGASEFIVLTNVYTDPADNPAGDGDEEGGEGTPEGGEGGKGGNSSTAAPAADPAPKTGDSSNMTLWAMLAAMSAAALAFFGIRNFKSRKNEG